MNEFEKKILTTFKVKEGKVVKRQPSLQGGAKMNKTNVRIQIEEEGQEYTMLKSQYISLKTRALKEYGYESLDTKHVAEQLELVLDGETTNLTVVGQFIKADKVKRL